MTDILLMIIVFLLAFNVALLAGIVEQMKHMYKMQGDSNINLFMIKEMIQDARYDGLKERNKSEFK